MNREELAAYAASKYQITPDAPFKNIPTYIAFRHTDNKKIFCLVMDVPGNKVGLSDDVFVDIIEIKCDPGMRMFLTGQTGILPAYHQKSGNWITIVLDGSVSDDQICSLLDISFELTSKGCKNGKPHNPYKIAPANPKIYDVDQAIIDGNGIFIWKQAKGAIVGDTIYLYVAAPVSAIRYACKVLEANIPYHNTDTKVNITDVMTLQVLHTFDPNAFTLDILKTYGVTTVRGPRSVPPALLAELKRYTNESDDIIESKSR